MSLKDFFNKNGRQGWNSSGNRKGPGSQGGTNGYGGQDDPGAQGSPGQSKGSMANKLTTALVVVMTVFVLFSILAGSFYTLSETESAVVTTLGQAAVNNNKGLQFKIPIIQEVTKINTTVQSFEVGYREEPVVYFQSSK